MDGGGESTDAVTKIVEEAFTSQYQDRAPPFTDAQASIISSVVENIFKERIQQAPSPKSLIQTNLNQIQFVHLPIGHASDIW